MSWSVVDAPMMWENHSLPSFTTVVLMPWLPRFDVAVNVPEPGVVYTR